MNSPTGRPPAVSDVGAAARDVAPIGAGMVLLGMSFGLLVVHTGLQWWWTPLFSGLVYAGSLEFLLVQLVAAGAPLAVMALTTLLVNGRHVFYGLTFPLHRVRSTPGRAYAVFALIDEAYALIATRPGLHMSSRRILATQAMLQASWVGGGIVGALAASSLASRLPAMDFVFTALFVVLAIEATAACRNVTDVAAAAGAGALGWWAGPAQMLLVAMSTYVVVVLIRGRLWPAEPGDHA